VEEVLVYQTEEFLLFLEQWSQDLCLLSQGILESSAIIAGFVGGCVVGAVFFYFVLK
jgi:hypothetical protein